MTPRAPGAEGGRFDCRGLPLLMKPPTGFCPFCLEPVGIVGNWIARLMGASRHGCDFRNVDRRPREVTPNAFVDEPDDRDAWAIVSPESGRIIVSSVRSTQQAALLCWWRDYRLSAAEFDAAGFRCVPVTISPTGSAASAGTTEGAVSQISTSDEGVNWDTTETPPP